MYKTVIAIMMLMIWASGCNPGKVSQDPATHQHDQAGSQFTLYSENIEFFIEHQPLEAGIESEFLVHLTDLSTYKPLHSGNVTILVDGVSVTSGKPHTAGIFEIPFVPRKAGSFHAEYIYQSGSDTESVSGHVHVVQDHDALHGGAEADQAHSHGSETEGEIAFLKEQAWKSDFMVREVTLAPFSSVIPTSGEILTVPGEKRIVAANSKGIVHFANNKLVQGSTVTRGQLLFILGSETLIENNVKLKYQESLNNYERSLSEYQRHRSLFYEGAISERQFVSTKSKFIADSLRFNSLAANISEKGLKVLSPVSGTIHELAVSEGTYAETGQLLATISSNRKLMIRADLSQQSFDQMKRIVTANFRPAYSDHVYSMEEVNGRLLAIGASVAENDHYLPVIFEVENDGTLLEGAFTEVFLKTSRKTDALTVPMSAISEEQGEHYVYVQVTGESYSKRPVTRGENDGRNCEIIGGLRSGERVVTKGVILVKAASMASGVVGQGHSH